MSTGKRVTGPESVSIYTETVELAALLKWAQVVPTGGQAKRLIEQGQVQVNGAVEHRRSRRVHVGDVVAVGQQAFRVVRMVR